MSHLKALAIAVLIGSAAVPAFAQDEITADTVVATVNGSEITVGHMLVVRSRLPQQYQSLPNEMLFDGILEQLIQQTLLGSGAGELSPASRYALENEERTLRAAEAAADIADAAASDEAIQAAYIAQYGSAEPEREFNASHILVETEEEALALIEELAGGADFATLAQEHSTGPSGPNGGNLGWFGMGMMVPPFEEAVVALEVGEVSDPVQTQFGWHVVTLNETREKAVPTLDEVRGEIEATLRDEAVQNRIAELMGNADVLRSEPGQIDPGVMGSIELLQE